MTFDDDSLVLDGARIPLVAVGLTWPPPEIISVNGVRWQLFDRSQITDEQRGAMTHVFRGAQYIRVTGEAPDDV